MKERRYFNYKKKGYTILHYLEKAKVSAIIDALDIDNIESIN